ncbi:hypothetical protein AAF712_000193 [Marasmius tenuissimus]|uniref:Amidohydrolase-related domain-containing protein n=1 Tax=Marasmius tenuissimus TaxID=585030 RepID=A0ABR3AG40_9AGAR
MEKSASSSSAPFPRKHGPVLYVLTFIAAIGLAYTFEHLFSARIPWALGRQNTVPISVQHALLQQCHSLRTEAGPPLDFHGRKESDRFVLGTRPTLIKNAKIWTGLENGTQVIHGDILLDKGLIKSVGRIPQSILSSFESDDLIEVDAYGRFVTPGIVDVHSHIGHGAIPVLLGAKDYDSPKGTIVPWMRTLDGLNTHDDSYALSVSGGVTTSLVLPGSANAIGGQAFVIKLRQTDELSPTSMLLEPPQNLHLNKSGTPLRYTPWRHMKHACGDTYSATRLDTIWAFREAYNEATKIKKQQDEFCARAEAGDFEGLGEFPQDLKWEALVDVIRGRVHVHCYEAVDLDALVRLSNEFKFPIAAFHHAMETYLVPDLLKRAYGSTPAVALYATPARYKREAYRASEFAPKILAQHGITVTIKSDHPLLDSRHLLYEVQQAYYYGLPDNLALAAVTSNSAEVMGMSHRIGHVKVGWDADIVIWDSHPLALGATPAQVYIDGIPQLDNPYVIRKPDSFQQVPKVPNFDKEAREAVKYQGLPPLTPRKSSHQIVVFTNVKSVFTRSGAGIQKTFSSARRDLGNVVVQNGKITCYGECVRDHFIEDPHTTIVDLEGGSIFPALVSYGGPLGLEAIKSEPSTNDGEVFDPLGGKPVPSVLGGDSAIVRAVDGLQYGTRDALLAYRAGVTTAITAPMHSNFLSGLGTMFSTGSLHKLEKGAIIQGTTSLHVSVRHLGSPSVSTQIAVLRRMLFHPPEGDLGHQFKRVVQGIIPLVVEAYNADIIATLVLLKKEVEYEHRTSIKMTITGGSEAHLLAKELANANVGVILTRPKPLPFVWEEKRILPGPPLTENSSISELIAHNVTVGIGVKDIWSARNARFDVAWAAIEANGKLSQEQAIALASKNIEILLGAEVDDDDTDMVATSAGDLFEMSAKVVAIVSSRQSSVELI